MTLFAACKSPVDLMRVARVAPPSPAIAVALRAMYGVPPQAGDRAIWGTISKVPWPSRKARRVAACCGRRSMKTSGLVAWSAVFELLCGGHEAYAAEGSRIYAVVICPRLAQAREAVRGIRGVLDALAPIGVRYAARDAGGSPELVITSPASRCVPVVSVQVADSVSTRGYACPFVAFDEAGFLPSEEWLAERDVDIVRAVGPAQLQFARALMMLASSPGRPGSYFHGAVEKPSRDTLVIRGATWIFNPRITEEQCLAEAGGDEAVFATEFGASRWGWAGSQFIDTEAAYRCVGSPDADVGPAPAEQRVCALDVGQLHDESGIVVCSSFEAEISPTVAPVRHVAVTHAEVIAASRKEPPSIEQIVARTVAVADGAPVLFDAFAGPTVKENFKKLGYREFVDPSGTRTPPPRSFMQCSMAPQHQTPRWKLLRDLVHGGRLHMQAHHESLAKELVGLSATMLSNGSLKVEGRKDNQADPLALCVPVAVRLPPVAGRAGKVEFEHDGLFFDGEGLRVQGGRWTRTRPDGRREMAGFPRWHPGFAEYAEEMIASGHSTPDIEAWRNEQREQQGYPSISVPVYADGDGPARAGFEWPGRRDSGDGREGWAFGKE